MTQEPQNDLPNDEEYEFDPEDESASLLKTAPHARLPNIAEVPNANSERHETLRVAKRDITLAKRRGSASIHKAIDLVCDSIASSSRFRRIAILATTAAMLISAVAIMLFLSGAQLCHGSQASSRAPSIGLTLPEIQHSWAAYTPYWSVKPYTTVPSHCKITQVNIIQRHGARFPTSGAASRIQAVVKKLQSATSYTDASLDFLRNYTWTLGSDVLVPLGASQSADAGKSAYKRYSQLIFKKNIPFVRAASGERVVDSATNWTLGFSQASDGVFNPVLAVILDEAANCTLDDAMCPNSGSSDVQTAAWAEIFGAPIAARLNTQAPGAGIVAADIPNLIPLCAFETVAKETQSPFCKLFTAAEFAQYEYWGDLDKYYNTGYGGVLGAVQGVGYINELLARLTGSAVQDNTQTNRTLDASPTTFPLDRTIYADFSHDNQMIAIYAALGLFNQTTALDPTVQNKNPKRTWITSQLTPFSARLVTERLTCTVAVAQGKGKGAQTKQETYVRQLVNDALQPLEFCGGDGNGLCTLSAFVQTQAYARNDGNGDFEQCYV